jgi:Zn finger protein HypA/HybF involved in hydrogenase expression
VKADEFSPGLTEIKIDSKAFSILYDPCPACGGHPVQATGGTEMRVKELEVE